MKTQLTKKTTSLSNYCEKNNIDLFLVAVDGNSASIIVNGMTSVISNAIMGSPEDSPKDIVKMAAVEIIKNEIIEKYKATKTLTYGMDKRKG